MHCSTARWTSALAVAALIALPVASSAQTPPPAAPPTPQTTSAAQPSADPKPADAQAQPAQDAKIDAAAAKEHLSQARDTGITKTLFGRIRQHPEINSRNGMRRSMAERTAINSPIQGTAADIIKLAMIRISEELQRQKLRTRMVLQVHDELIFEIPEEELSIRETIRELMQNVVQLNVPLIVDVNHGLTWAQLK